MVAYIVGITAAGGATAHAIFCLSLSWIQESDHRFDSVLFCVEGVPLTTMPGEDDGPAALPDVALPSPQPELDKNYVLRLAEHWCVYARSVALRRIGLAHVLSCIS